MFCEGCDPGPALSGTVGGEVTPAGSGSTAFGDRHAGGRVLRFLRTGSECSWETLWSVWRRRAPGLQMLLVANFLRMYTVISFAASEYFAIASLTDSTSRCEMILLNASLPVFLLLKRSYLIDAREWVGN